ncbi:PaaI family thioesterase [soil metagenome]
MRRPSITIEALHERQLGKLPDHFGARITDLQDGRMDMELEIQPWMIAPNGYLHAATVILLADTACGYACWAHIPEGAKGFTTVELKSNFLSTTRSGMIRTEAVAEHMGRTTQVWSATVFNEEGRKMALFRCTQVVLW